MPRSNTSCSCRTHPACEPCSTVLTVFLGSRNLTRSHLPSERVAGTPCSGQPDQMPASPRLGLLTILLHTLPLRPSQALIIQQESSPAHAFQIQTNQPEHTPPTPSFMEGSHSEPGRPTPIILGPGARQGHSSTPQQAEIAYTSQPQACLRCLAHSLPGTEFTN